MFKIGKKPALKVSIRTTLVAVCVVPLLLAVSNIGYFTTEIRDYQIRAELNRNLVTAQMVATQTRYVIDSVASHLYALGSVPAMRTGDAAACETLLRGALDNLRDPSIQLPLERLGRVRPDGVLDCSTVAGVNGIPVADRAYFRLPRQTGHYAVTDLVRGRVTGSFIVVVSVPLAMAWRETTDTGVLITGMTTRWMSDALAKMNTGEETWMIDSGGMIVAAHPGEAAAGQEMPNYDLITRHIGDGDSGIAFLEIDDTPYTLVYARIPNTPFKVLVMESEASIFGPVWKILLTMTLTILSLTGLAAVAAWGLCRIYLLKPITALVEATHKIRSGDFSLLLDPPAGASELQVLGRAVDEMVQALSLKEEIIQAQISNLEELAFYDRLTGLANMRLFRRDLDVAVRKVERTGELLVVFNIDLNGLKSVNDTYGHAAGDQLLQAAGHRISVSIRPTDTAARNGGDEFLVLMLAPGLQAAMDTGRRLVRNLHHPVDLEHRVVQGRAAVGMAWHAGGSPDLKLLLQRADAAMYQAKAASSRQQCSAFQIWNGDLMLMEHPAETLEIPPAAAA
jgi:diguanylate cyclase (GGDEF)-like protein